ncbi:hypothetical protein CR513_07084, partial [Mucuna pruriens]
MENNKRKGKDEKEIDEEEEEEKEEMKMDKFYALLRKFRDARDRRRKELEELEKSEKKKRKVGTHTQTQQQTHVWVPSFEWEDFTNEVQFRPPITSTSTSHSPRATHRHLHDSLDLNLAL